MKTRKGLELANVMVHHVLCRNPQESVNEIIHQFLDGKILVEEAELRKELEKYYCSCGCGEPRLFEKIEMIKDILGEQE